MLKPGKMNEIAEQMISTQIQIIALQLVWSYRKNARNKNGQSHTLLETHFKEANRKAKDTLGGWY